MALQSWANFEKIRKSRNLRQWNPRFAPKAVPDSQNSWKSWKFCLNYALSVLALRSSFLVYYKFIKFVTLRNQEFSIFEFFRWFQNYFLQKFIFSVFTTIVVIFYNNFTTIDAKWIFRENLFCWSFQKCDEVYKIKIWAKSLERISLNFKFSDFTTIFTTILQQSKIRDFVIGVWNFRSCWSI